MMMIIIYNYLVSVTTTSYLLDHFLLYYYTICLQQYQLSRYKQILAVYGNSYLGHAGAGVRAASFTKLLLHFHLQHIFSRRIAEKKKQT